MGSLGNFFLGIFVLGSWLRMIVLTTLVYNVPSAAQCSSLMSHFTVEIIHGPQTNMSEVCDFLSSPLWIRFLVMRQIKQ